MGRHLPSPRTTLAVLTGLNLVNYLDRFIPAAVLPAIIATLGLSGAEAGALQMVFILSYALASPAAGWLGDRRARFHVAAIGVLVWSAATFGSGLAATFAMMLLARALTGVGEASYTVVTPSLIADFFPPERRARTLAIFYAAIPVGSALGFILGGAINARWGWRAAFFLAGAPGIALAVVLFFFRDPVRGTFDRADTGSPSTGVRAFLSALAARPSYLFNTASQVLYTFAMGGLAFWMPTYFHRERHIPLEEASRNFGLVLVLAGFAGTLLGGRLGDAVARRRSDGHFLVSAAALLASLPFTLLALLHSSPAIFWPSMFVTLLLLFINTGPLNAAMVNVLPAALRARGFALYSLAIHLLGDALSPLLIGAVSDRTGLGPPVLATGVLLFAAGLVLWVGRSALRRDLQAAVPA